MKFGLCGASTGSIVPNIAQTVGWFKWHVEGPPGLLIALMPHNSGSDFIPDSSLVGESMVTVTVTV